MELGTDDQKATVLLVDDDVGVLVAYGKVLTRAGLEVLRACNGADAMQTLRTCNIDAIVSDINMPVLGGIPFLRAVRAEDLDVPVILMTGAPNTETAVQAVEYGAFQYLIKPMEAEPFLAAVQRAIRIHKLSKLRRLASLESEIPSLGLPDRAALESRFERALERLWIAYQPIVSWSVQSVFSYEALVRSDEKTLSNPADLFDAASRLGRTSELGRVIRSRVAENAATFPDQLLFVNLNPSDLNDPELYLTSSMLGPYSQRIVLEITERAGLESVDGLGDKLAQLRRLGFRIAIDDLGAGYSSLSSFIHLEPEFVKLDMSLVRDVHLSPRKQALVRGLLQICSRDLGIDVICEGIETPEERDCLIREGLDLMQGYLFARPGRAFPAVSMESHADTVLEQRACLTKS